MSNFLAVVLGYRRKISVKWLRVPDFRKRRLLNQPKLGTGFNAGLLTGYKSKNIGHLEKPTARAAAFVSSFPVSLALHE